MTVPNSVVPQEKKEVLLGPSVRFIKEIHRKYGWNWET